MLKLYGAMPNCCISFNSLVAVERVSIISMQGNFLESEDDFLESDDDSSESEDGFLDFGVGVWSKKDEILLYDATPRRRTKETEFCTW